MILGCRSHYYRNIRQTSKSHWAPAVAFWPPGCYYHQWFGYSRHSWASGGLGCPLLRWLTAWEDVVVALKVQTTLTTACMLTTSQSRLDIRWERPFFPSDAEVLQLTLTTSTVTTILSLRNASERSLSKFPWFLSRHVVTAGSESPRLVCKQRAYGAPSSSVVTALTPFLSLIQRMSPGTELRG